MVFMVEKEELVKAEGTMKYNDCKYDNGKALVGDAGTWKAEKEEDIDLDEEKDTEGNELDTDEYEYEENDIQDKELNTGEYEYAYDDTLHIGLKTAVRRI